MILDCMCLFLAPFPVPPQISPFDFGEVPVNSGDVAVVSCVVIKGDFPLNISWLFNGKTLFNQIGISLTNNRRSSQLTVESVSSENAGEYSCIAKNDAGESVHSAILNVNGTVKQTVVTYTVILNKSLCYYLSMLYGLLSNFIYFLFQEYDPNILYFEQVFSIPSHYFLFQGTIVYFKLFF